MILSRRNYFIQLTILLIIATFTKGFFVPTNRKKTDNDKELKQKVPKGQIYYHRNDIGHLNEYYQERNKLRQEYNAIQKSLDEQNLKNNTNVEKNNFDYRLLETSNFLDSSPPDRLDKNVNETLINASTTNENSNLTSGIQNTQNYSQNKTFVQIGECKGYVLYTQNIVITGANYRATNGYLVEINFDGLCITCIEIKSKNNKEIKIKVISGGPGKPNTSLNFEELDKDFDFSYLLKIWGVGEKC